MAAYSCHYGSVQHHSELCDIEADTQAIYWRSFGLKWDMVFHYRHEVTHASLVFPVTALQARTFAVWTLTSAIIRGYAAYNINNKTCVVLLVRNHPA